MSLTLTNVTDSIWISEILRPHYDDTHACKHCLKGSANFACAKSMSALVSEHHCVYLLLI